MQVRGSATCLGTKQGKISDSHLQLQALARERSKQSNLTQGGKERM